MFCPETHFPEASDISQEAITLAVHGAVYQIVCTAGVGSSSRFVAYARLCGAGAASFHISPARA